MPMHGNEARTSTPDPPRLVSGCLRRRRSGGTSTPSPDPGKRANKTSPMVSTNVNLNPSAASEASSSRSPRFRAGSSTCRIPPRRAASTLSRTPPTGNIRPRKVILFPTGERGDREVTRERYLTLREGEGGTYLASAGRNSERRSRGKLCIVLYSARIREAFFGSGFVEEFHRRHRRGHPLFRQVSGRTSNATTGKGTTHNKTF